MRCGRDMNNDTYPDLVLVGDWMPVTYFINNKGSIIENSRSLKQFRFMELYSQPRILIKMAIQILYLETWGLNSRFRASVGKPMEMYVNDFDDNGTYRTVYYLLLARW